MLNLYQVVFAHFHSCKQYRMVLRMASQEWSFCYWIYLICSRLLRIDTWMALRLGIGTLRGSSQILDHCLLHQHHLFQNRLVIVCVWGLISSSHRYWFNTYCSTKSTIHISFTEMEGICKRPRLYIWCKLLWDKATMYRPRTQTITSRFWNRWCWWRRQWSSIWDEPLRVPIPSLRAIQVSIRNNREQIR
jgi:hypothetical protein